MDLYGQKSASLPQKTVIVLLEMLFLWLSYWILFQDGGALILHWLGIKETGGSEIRRIIIFTFSLIVFLRLSVTLFYLLKRYIPWEESFSIPIAFALYYVGYSLFVFHSSDTLGLVDYFAILLFLFGSFLNTFSELQRHFWKQKPEHKGKIYTRGLFSWSMHINYFGDLCWVTAYALITRNIYAIVIPVFLFCFFVFYNIPKLDHYLASKYGTEFEEYRQKTKKFIPFVY